MQDAFDADALVIQPEEDHVGTVGAGPQSGAQIRSFGVSEGRTPDPGRMFKKLFFELERARWIIQRNEV